MVCVMSVEETEGLYLKLGFSRRQNSYWGLLSLVFLSFVALLPTCIEKHVLLHGAELWGS
jgi:hypothetical protein